MHLNHYLAKTGICSRRNASVLIKEGHIRVNGAVETKPYYIVQKNDKITYKNRLLSLQKKIYIVLNKPMDYVSTTSDELGRKTIFDLVQLKKIKLFSIGRLDKDTSGLIILTNDGDLAQRISHPRYTIEKTYAVMLDKPLTHDDMLHIKKGIRLQDGLVNIDKISGPINKKIIHISLHSGKKRIIRRLFGHLDYNVIHLDRIKIASINKKNLKVGAWRYLTAAEIRNLEALVSAEE